MNNEMRQNRLTGQWVIYAPGRGQRPNDFVSKDETDAVSLAQHVQDCPFCPGNEEMLPEIIYEASTEQGTHWQTRVVPNKFPVLSAETEHSRKQEGFYVRMSGYGHHEVIIEHPRHDLDLPDMAEAEVRAVIDTYHQRYLELLSDNANMMVILFRNHGAKAGTSIRHPHSQLIATGVVPRHVRWREDIAQAYFDTWGTSLLDDMLDYEREVQERIVCENDSFVTFVPYAAEIPYEMWIVPRRQQADFGAIREDEKGDLTRSLQDSLRRLNDALDRPDYNLVVHTAARYKADEPHLHWYIQVRPRILTRAGFEIGSGMRVNPSIPEEDAHALRSAIAG